MDKHPVPEQAVCCFCGEALPLRNAPLLVLYTRIGSDDNQNLFTHANCLRDRVIDEVILITELEDD